MALKRSRSGRRYSDGPSRGEADWLPSDSPDPRLKLPDAERKVRQEALPNGTILTTYDDPPLPQLLAEDPDPLGPEPQRWRRDKPTEPQGKGRDRWSRLR